MSISARLVCVGCCLVLACSGCILPDPGQRGILQDDQFSEFDQISWDDFPQADQEGRFELARGSAAESQPGPDSEPESPAPPVPEAPSSEEADDESCDSQESCDTPATLERGLSCQMYCALGVLGRPLWARIEEWRYRHPRFHPVPLQPVFTPPIAQGPVADPDLISEPNRIPRLPAEGSPQIEIVLPALPPMETPPPPGEPEHRDRVTLHGRPLETASRPGSWIFNPPISTPLGPDRVYDTRSAQRGYVTPR